MKAILLSLLLLVISGCSALAPKSTGALVKGVEEYCQAVTHEARLLIRHQVNEELAARSKDKANPPQVAGVRCPGDPD